MIKFYKDLYLFLKNCEAESLFKLNKRGLVVYSLINYFLFIVLFSLVLKFLDEAIGIPAHKSSSSLKGKSILYILSIGVFIVPVIEELGFRLYLKYSKINLSISCAVLAYFFVSVISETKLYQLSGALFYKLFFCLALAILFFLLLNRDRKKLLQQFWIRNQQAIIYFSILIFSAIHVRNLILVDTSDYLLAPLLLLPQILLATLLAYTRYRAGIGYAMLIHGFANLPAVIGAIAANS